MAFDKHDPQLDAQSGTSGLQADVAHKFLDDISGHLPQSLQDRIDAKETALKGKVATTAEQHLPQEFAAIAKLASFLPDGSIQTDKLVALANHIPGGKLDNQTVDFLRGFDTISKKGDHFEFHRSQDATVPINKDVPGTHGLVTTDGVKISSLSFDLKHENGATQLQHLKGLNIEFSAAGQTLESGVTDLSVGKGPDGKPLVVTHLENPTPELAKFFINQPDKIPVDIAFDDSGKVKVINAGEIKDAVEGHNPLVRGYLDTFGHVTNFFSSPSLSGAGDLAKDAAYVAVLGPVGPVAENVVDSLKFW